LNNEYQKDNFIRQCSRFNSYFLSRSRIFTETTPTEVPPTETPPPDLDCNFNCVDLYAIDDAGDKIDDNQLQELEPQEVCFEVKGWTDCEQGITEARFKIIGDDDWGWGDFQRDEDNTGGNGRFYYYNWCYDFSEITEPCYDIDAEVCVEGTCR